MAMYPPTRVTCTELAELGSVAEVLAAAPARRIAPVMPRLVHDGGEYYMESELP